MKFVVQRVSNASVEVNSKIVGEIEKGFLVLVGIKIDDTKEIADFMVSKLAKLRIFEDEAGKMNLSIKDVKGKLLLVSQFTLYANCKGGNRPDFVNAAKPEYAKELYEYVVQKCKQEGIEVQTGIFREEMKVRLLNDGPVTIIMDSSEIMNK
jgi:D-tyrosyl-tRNA(Tyr) deacylase